MRPCAGVFLHLRPLLGQAGVRPLFVIIAQPVSDELTRLPSILEIVQIDTLVFERVPETLDEDVVPPSALSVHRDLYPSLPEELGELPTRELAAMIGVEDLRPAIAAQPLLQGLLPGRTVQGVRQPPRKHRARRPVHDRHQIVKTSLHWIGYVRAPHLVGQLDPQMAKTIRIDPMASIRRRGLRLAVDGRHPHLPHQSTHPLAADIIPLASQVTGHLPLTVPSRRPRDRTAARAPHLSSTSSEPPRTPA